MVSPATAVVKQTPAMIACANTLALKTKSETDLATNITTMQTNFAARLAKITANEKTIDTKIATNRTNAKKNFEDKIQKLELQTKPTKLSDTQKQAVQTYKINMEKAETNREESVDSARATYRISLLNIVKARQQTITESVNIYQATVQSTFMTAEAKCADGKTTVNNANLKTSIQFARQTLTATKTESEIKTQIKKLATTRNAAIQAAKDKFSKQTATYSDTLKIALGK